MPRGGPRQGAPGQAYANRTDMQAVKVATGQPYGVAKQQAESQKVVPLAGRTSPGPSASPAAAPARQAKPPGPHPGQITPLDAPTMRPGEPVTAGLSVGAGPGVEANPFSNVGSDDDAVLAIRAAYAAYPSEALRAMLERVDLG